jgi:hypothetical protein
LTVHLLQAESPKGERLLLVRQSPKKTHPEFASEAGQIESPRVSVR